MDSSAALLRLNDGNQAFATLLKSLSDESVGVRQIISVDSRDLGLLPGGEGVRVNGIPVQRAQLRNRDRIQIGSLEIEFFEW